MTMPSPSPVAAGSRKWVYLVISLLVTGVLRAQTPRTGSVDDAVLYQIGGGSAVPMSHAGSMPSIGVGIGWKSNLVCGKMDLTTTLSNQLNGVTTGFKTIMSGVVQNATAAVASLPALIIQRADPGLYNLLTNGVLQARLDFDRAKLTCRTIANRMADIAEGQLSWNQLSEGLALQNLVSGRDAVSAIQGAENIHGNNGVPWIGGTNAGGAGQNPISVVGDVARAGYNMLTGRAVAETSSIDPATCNNSLVCQTWNSPDAAAAWAVRVLGETQVQTCDGCTTTQTTPGVGLTPLIQETYATKLQALYGLISGTQPISSENLQAAGSSAVPITRGVIEALRDEQDQNVLSQRLASEVALSTVLEQALTLQRTLLTGRQEPNVSANGQAQQTISHESELLEQEINNLKSELELRRELVANSPMEIIQRERSRIDSSHGIFQGDPIRDRVDQVQKQGGTTY